MSTSTAPVEVAHFRSLWKQEKDNADQLRQVFNEVKALIEESGDFEQIPVLANILETFKHNKLL